MDAAATTDLESRLAGAQADIVAARAGEARYHALFDSIDDGFCVVEVMFDAQDRAIDYRFVETNPAFVRQTGLEDAVGRTMRELAPDHEQRWFDIYGRIALTGEPARFEDRAAALGRWYEVHAFRVDDPADRHVAILFRDILERRRAESALRASDERLRALVGSGSASIYRMSPDWRLMYELDSRDFLATTPAPIADWPDRYILADDRDLVAASIAEAIRTRSVFALEHRVALADGSVGWVASRAVPMLGADGEVVEWFGAGVYITDRKRADDALRELEAHQSFLLALSDTLRPLTDAREIQTIAMRRLAELLDVHHTGYYDADSDGAAITLAATWERDAPELPDRIPLDIFGADVADGYRAGRTAAIDDLDHHGASEADRAIFRALGLQAWIAVPVIKGDRLVTLVGVHSKVARPWTRAEIRLVEQVADRTWVAVERARAEAALRDRESNLRTLVAELQHRVRNILTVIRLTFSRTFESEGTREDHADHFRGRLDAMARTQVLLTHNADRTADLESLIRNELLSVGVSDGPSVVIDGPELMLDHKTAEALGMAIHELTTNALKYGALRISGASLEIVWRINMDVDGDCTLALTWTEQGVPAIGIDPDHQGFGRELIEEALPYRLGAETRLQFLGGGVRCSISVPLATGAMRA